MKRTIEGNTDRRRVWKRGRKIIRIEKQREHNLADRETKRDRKTTKETVLG